MYCYYIKNIIIIYMIDQINKEGYKNSDDEPKISKKEKNNILKILVRTLIIVLIVMIFLILNANIIFNIKDATKAILNISFPSECDELPFGTKDVNPCMDGLDWAQKATKKLMCLMKGGTKDPENCNDPRSLPYRWFKKNPENIFDDYVNWFTGSLAHTQISLNTGVKNVLQWLKTQPAANSTVLIILSLILLKLAVIVVCIYVFCSLIFNQVTSIWKHEILTGILIFFTGIFVFFIDYIIAVIDALKIFIELAIKPIFNKEKRQYVLNIVRDQRIIVGYIFGFAFLQILDSIKMNKHYEKPVKLIPAFILYTMIIVHFVKWIYSIVTTTGGNSSSDKCKK